MLGLFKNKKSIFKNGEKILDLTKKSIEWTNKEILIDDTVYVTKDFEMRSDLISQSAYGTSYAQDVFLKYNGISNPFSIESGDVIIIPNLGDMLTCFIEEKEEKIDTSKNTRKTIKNISKEKFNKEIKENWKDKITPNIAKTNNGDFLPPNIEIKQGKITFGGNIGKPKEECCSEPLSKSEFLKKIIKNRIKNGG